MLDVSTSIKSSSIKAGEQISVLPLANDGDKTVEGLIKIAVTDAGKNYVEGTTDPFWNEVLKEVEWDERKSDMLDQNTLVKFGKLQATKILVYGSVRAAEVSNGRVFVEIELHASSLTTKQHVWGGVFTKRIYAPGGSTPVGISEIPVETRISMQQLLTKQAETSIQRQSKLKGLKTVAFVPLAGDIDRYATFIIRDAVTRTELAPKDMDLMTLGEVRQIIREQPQVADGILYGALRDLSMQIASQSWRTTTYDVTAEVQASIENSTGEILWSDTLLASSQYSVTKSWRVWIYEDVLPYLSTHPLAWIIPAVVLLGIFLLLLFIKANSRVR